MVLSVKELAYVEAAGALGASTGRVMARHVAPQCVAPFLIITTGHLGAAIFIEAALSFVGVSIDGLTAGLKARLDRTLPLDLARGRVAYDERGLLTEEVTDADIPPEEWERELHRAGLPEYLTRPLVTMDELHRAGWYDRLADGVERVTGRPAMSVREFVSLYADEFGGRRL